MVPWESWAYFRDTGESMIYHFARFPSDYAEPNLSGGNLMSAGGTLDYVLVKNVDCGVVDYRHLEYDRRLTTLERRCDAMKRLAVGALVRRDARVGLRTESALPPIAVELPFHYDYYTFRGTNDQTDIVAAIGVPLNRERALRLALTVADTGTAAVARAEALTPSVAPSAGQSGMLRTHLTVQAAPTKQALHRISLFDADDERAGKMYGGPMEIRGYRGDTLMVSDVVIADPGEHGAFRRGDLSFTLSPTQVFPRGEFRVFYEIYNLAPRATYRTEISVQSADRGVRGTLKRLFGKEEPVVLAFSGVAPDVMSENVLQEVRAVQAPLPPGTYQLKVSITAEGVRRPLVRERRFTIVE